MLSLIKGCGDLPHSKYSIFFYDFKLAGEKRLFDISSLDEWRTQAYENANCLKKKLKDGMTKGYKSMSLM